MTKPQRKRTLVVLRHPPYGNSLARAAVDLGLAMGAFEQDFDLLFMGDGVLQLLAGQESAQIGVKNIGRVLGSLPLYDVETVYVDGAALARHGLVADDLVLPARILAAGDLHAFLDDADHLVSC